MRVRKICLRCHSILMMIMLSGLWCNLPVIASQQAYIDAIKADAEEFSTGTFNPPVDSPWIATDPVATDVSKRKGEGLDAFAEFLQAKFPGTYLFYQRLPVEFQHKVHEEYLATGDTDRVKKSVFRYLSDRRR